MVNLLFPIITFILIQCVCTAHNFSNFICDSSLTGAVVFQITDGLVRGMVAVDTGSAITVPVGDATLGRLLNVVGDTIDNNGEIKDAERWGIHREAPTFSEQNSAKLLSWSSVRITTAL